MAVALHNSEHVTVTAGSNQTKTVSSLTVHASATKLVVKLSSYHGDSSSPDNVISAIRWNGDNLTIGRRSEDLSSQHERAEIWYLDNPDTGAHDLEIDFGVSGNPFGTDVIAEYWSGAAAGIGDSDGVYDPNVISSIALSLTTSAGGVVTDFIYNNSAAAITPGTGQTPIFEGTDLGGAERICASYEAEEDTPSMAFASASRSAYVAIELLEAGAPSTGSAHRLGLLGVS
jgi:hypothetical protein